MQNDAARVPMANPLGWAALMVVYFVWGSTYLAIRIGVEDIQPLALAGLRYLSAGLLLYPFAIRSGSTELRRSDVPRARHWLSAGLIGFLLLVLGNGGLTIAEETLGSGFAAVLVATVPLWMVAFAWPLNRQRPSARATAGLVIGLFGVAVLANSGSASGRLSGMFIVLGASAAWGLGSVVAGKVTLPQRALVAAALEMLVAGSILLVAAFVHGDFGSIRWSRIHAVSWLALAYLIVPGSILAFTAYGYALTRLPLPTVSTYAYVNPVVAVLLGVIILSEPLTAHEVVGTILVVASVRLTLPNRRPQTPSGHRRAPRERHDLPMSSHRSDRGIRTLLKPRGHDGGLSRVNVRFSLAVCRSRSLALGHAPDVARLVRHCPAHDGGAVGLGFRRHPRAG
jgi:drug/metabolite transporter (DMT)-like permease